MVFKMIKQIIIFVKDKEFYDDAQLLARSFFAGAKALDADKYDPDHSELPGIKTFSETVTVSENENICIINADVFVPADEERTGTRGEIHDRFKRRLYLELVKVTGRRLPWGFLTGVRPAKRAGEILDESEKNNVKDKDEMIRKFCDRFLSSEEKARLAFEVAKNERNIFAREGFKKAGEGTGENGFSLYVGIPFCPTTCLYCSFTSMAIGKCDDIYVKDYVDALCFEIEAGAALMNERSAKGSREPLSPRSIYIGGGTPTALEPEHLHRMIRCIKDNFDVRNDREFTVEAGRPDSITPARLKVLKDEGVNRISVNPQTMNDETLKLIGRDHTASDVERAFYLVRESGFDNINMDIILGLPGEGKEHVMYTAERIRRLGPDSLTVHSLAVKRAAGLNIKRDEYSHLRPENSGEIMAVTADLAKEMDMHPYYMYRQQNMAGNFENVGYARAGKESLYNIVIMEEVQDILAVGAGASSKFLMPGNRYERAINVKSVRDYIDRTDEMVQRKRRLLN